MNNFLANITIKIDSRKTQMASNLIMIKIILLRIYPREMKIMFTKQNICTQLFIAVLLVIAKNWKQAKCPSMVEFNGSAIPLNTS